MPVQTKDVVMMRHRRHHDQDLRPDMTIYALPADIAKIDSLESSNL